MLERAEKSAALEIHSVEQLVSPLDLLVKQKVAKAYSSVLSVFQTLAASGYLSFAQKLLFLDTASKLMEASDEMVPIRILQVLLILITRSDVGRPPMAIKILQLCLKAFGCKNTSVKSNVFAVLRQLSTLLFEEYGKTLDDGLQKVCYDVLDQLIIAAGDKYKQLRFKCLAMDMLTVILAECRETLRRSSQITELIENAYTPWLRNYLVHETESYPVISRVMKSATQLMLALRGSYILLQPVLAMTASAYSWHRYLALESFRALFGDHRQIQSMYATTNEATGQPVLCTDS